MTASRESSPSRRDLLRTGAVTAAAIGTAPYSSAGKLLRPGGDEMLKVGLVGCGGRCTLCMFHATPQLRDQRRFHTTCAPRERVVREQRSRRQERRAHHGIR